MTSAAPTDADIQRVVDLVVETVQPLRVVLFGSAARGDQAHGSDVDMMVVVAEGVDTMRTSHELHRARLRAGVTAVPVDFVVVTPNEVERYRDSIGMVYREVARDGRDLYVA